MKGVRIQSCIALIFTRIKAVTAILQSHALYFFEEGSFTRSHNPKFQSNNRARVILSIIQYSQPRPTKESRQNQPKHARPRTSTTRPALSLHLKPKTPQERPEANYISHPAILAAPDVENYHEENRN